MKIIRLGLSGHKLVTLCQFPMSSFLRKLVSDTAIYGLASIVMRAVNYLLNPLFAYSFAEHQFGVISDFYAIAGLMMVFFTYRMETAFFHFGKQEGEEREQAFATALGGILITTVVLVLLLIIFHNPIANILHHHGKGWIVILFAFILGFDALSEIPLARMRLDAAPYSFVRVRFIWILCNVTLNVFFLWVCPFILKSQSLTSIHPFILKIYSPSFGVGYVFVANLIASALAFCWTIPWYDKVRVAFNRIQFRSMWKYSWPLMIAGLAGIVNEMMDRQLLKYLLPTEDRETFTQIGIYSASYKLTMMITIFGQAWRYAAEPMFFKESQNKNAPDTFGQVTFFFILANIIGVMCILFLLPCISWFVGPEGSRYREGLRIVPILLVANVFLGIYYNVSNWYRIKNMTRYGAWIAVLGMLITLIINGVFIPTYGYMASAWATLICYVVMVIVCVVLGQKHYPIPYRFTRLFIYSILATLLILLGLRSESLEGGQWLVKVLLLGIFIYMIWRFEKVKEILHPKVPLSG